jgi:cysteine sulfinate desulfinase/cysteine desulfurase-like protein
MTEAMECYGNPSSIYDAGRKSRAIVEEARRRVAESLNCTARRIIFTGSGSESDNLAVKGAALAAGNGKNHIITSDIEHAAVRNACAWLAGRGYEVTLLPVDAYGIVNPADLERYINDRTALVTIMLANNETGSIQPIRELASIAKKKNVLFHSDCTQAMGRISVDVHDLGADLVTISGHKFHGPKGVGALYCRRDVPLTGLISGGEHEWGIRAGTENVLGIAGFGAAVLTVPRLLSCMGAVRLLRDRLEGGIKGLVTGARLNGHPQDRLPNTLNMTLPGYRGESMVIAMDRHRVYFSSGSACQAGSPEPSHALLAMGLSESDAHCSLRFSLGYENTGDEIDRVVRLMALTIRESKSTIHFVPCR